MIDIDIPDYGTFGIRHLVIGYNGTLALDGRLLPGVPEVLGQVSRSVEVHVVTADTFGLAEKYLDGLPVALTILPEGGQAESKLDYIQNLGTESVIAIGKGSNDWKMLQAAAIGIALIQREGGSAQAVTHADMISTDIIAALELLLHPKRLIATLRS